jgi:hypothetical protein
VKAGEHISLREYILPGKKLDMERILMDFYRYITQIGVNAFTRRKNLMRKPGSFC